MIQTRGSSAHRFAGAGVGKPQNRHTIPLPFCPAVWFIGNSSVQQKGPGKHILRWPMSIVVKTIPESISRHMNTAWSPAQSLHGEALLFHEQKSCAASHISGFGRGHAVSAWRNEPQSKMSRCRKLKFTAGVGHPDTILVASSSSPILTRDE
jgi:hypothetical protein